MLRFQNFHKSYSGITVLAIKDLSLAQGIYWIRGANGAGKSTLLKAAAGIIDFNGDVFVDSISIKKDSVKYRRLVNFADAEPVFPEFLTGMEMIRLFSKAKGGSETQPISFLESMNMQAWINEPLGTYSSGMLKKLSLVLAFLGNPKFILLDEPLITLDAESLNTLYSWIVAEHTTNKTSFLISSHQPFTLANNTEKTLTVDSKTATLQSQII